MLVNASATENTPEELFFKGKREYLNAEFEAAIETFKSAVSQVPESSVYHHWLGKSYGRLAENAGIFAAYGLSQKTREQFELAVKLDNRNREAILDLIKFYQRAPVFLGGGQEKAERLRDHLERLQVSRKIN